MANAVNDRLLQSGGYLPPQTVTIELYLNRRIHYSPLQMNALSMHTFGHHRCILIWEAPITFLQGARLTTNFELTTTILSTCPTIRWKMRITTILGHMVVRFTYRLGLTASWAVRKQRQHRQVSQRAMSSIDAVLNTSWSLLHVIIILTNYIINYLFTLVVKPREPPSSVKNKKIDNHQ